MKICHDLVCNDIGVLITYFTYAKLKILGTGNQGG